MKLLLKNKRNIIISTGIIAILIISSFLFYSQLPSGIEKKKVAVPDITMDVPRLSTYDETCCMYTIYFKNIRSVSILEKEMEEIMAPYEKVKVGNTYYYYNREEDFHIIEYGVKKGFIFNEIYFVIDIGYPSE